MIASSSPGSTRRVSLPTATSLVIANMIGTGIFTSLGFQVRDLPSAFPVLVLWLVGGLCALCGALAYAELAAALPRSGGEYHFLSRIFHPAFGFLAGWISATVGFAAPVALAAMAFGKYVSHVTPGLPAIDLPTGSALRPELYVSLLAVVLIAAVHLRGIRLGSLFQNVMTALKVLLIVSLICAGVSRGTQPISFLPRPGDMALITSGPFAVSLIFVMYAYSGWNASTYIVSEIRDPARNIPQSVTFGTFFVTVLYVGLNAVFLYTAPLNEIKGVLEVGHVAATHIFGPAGGRIMAGLICVGLISSISAMTWVGPRVTMTMGEDCRALRVLARKTRSGVPAMAIIAQTAIVAALLLTATFETVLTYIQFSLTFCSFLTVFGVIVLRRTNPTLPRPYKMWGFPLTPLIFLAITLWMMWHVLQSSPRESLAGLGTMLLGLAIYAIAPTRPPVVEESVPHELGP